MYIVVRKDLDPGAILAQSCHVAFQFAHEKPLLSSHWIINSNYICILEVNDENELSNIFNIAKESGVECTGFIEPDYNNSLTAIALEPGGLSKKICRNLKLAFKN